MGKSKEDLRLENLRYPTDAMKEAVSVAGIRLKVKNIAREISDHSAMYKKYEEGKSKIKTQEEKDQYEIGCSKLKEWLKNTRLEDGTSLDIDFTKPAKGQETYQPTDTANRLPKADQDRAKHN